MINRAYIHIAGQPGEGKTALIEATLASMRYDSAFCVHAVRESTLRKPKEITSREDPHLKRYDEAGAIYSMLYRYPGGAAYDNIDFYERVAITDYSDIIFIEGDSPIDYSHLSVYVTRPLPEDATLLYAGKHDTHAERSRELEKMEQLAEHPELLLELLPSGVGLMLESIGDKSAAILEDISEVLRLKTEELRALPAPEPTDRWKLAESHHGIRDAGMVVVNIHDESERELAAAMVADVARLRSDKKVFDDVLGWQYHRTPITAVVANLADKRDAGRKKAIARIKRAIKMGREG